MTEENIGDDEIDEALGSGEKPNPFDPMFKSSVNVSKHFKSQSIGSTTDRLNRSPRNAGLLMSYAKVREEQGKKTKKTGVEDFVDRRFE